MANRKSIYDALKKLWDIDPSKSFATSVYKLIIDMDIHYYMESDEDLPETIYTYMNPCHEPYDETEDRNRERKMLFQRYIELFEKAEGDLSLCLIESSPQYDMKDEEYLKILADYVEMKKKAKKLHVTGITLLSSSEFVKFIGFYPAPQLLNTEDWWLRDPEFGDENGINVCFVPEYDYYFGTCTISYDRADNEHGVRPVLLIDNLKDLFKINEEFILGDEQWVVISESMAIARYVVFDAVFKKDCSTQDIFPVPAPSDYEHSDLKAELKKWAEENDLLK